MLVHKPQSIAAHKSMLARGIDPLKPRCKMKNRKYSTIHTIFQMLTTLGRCSYIHTLTCSTFLNIAHTSPNLIANLISLNMRKVELCTATSLQSKVDYLRTSAQKIVCASDLTKSICPVAPIPENPFLAACICSWQANMHIKMFYRFLVAYFSYEHLTEVDAFSLELCLERRRCWDSLSPVSDVKTVRNALGECP